MLQRAAISPLDPKISKNNSDAAVNDMRGVVGEHSTSTNDDSPRAHVLGFAAPHIISKPFPNARTGTIVSLYEASTGFRLEVHRAREQQGSKLSARPRGSGG